MCNKFSIVKKFNALLFTTTPVTKPVCIAVFKKCQDVKVIEYHTKNVLEFYPVKPYKIDIIPIEIPSHLFYWT